ncbi:unnamed protein product, partial [Arctia plantaginis]
VLLGDDEDSLALVFQHVKPEDAGIYTCVAKTSTGNISCSAELTVQDACDTTTTEFTAKRIKLGIFFSRSIYVNDCLFCVFVRLALP